MYKQQGYTLTEVAMAVGVIAALVIGGSNFYSNAIAKAQANQGMVIGKLIVDDVISYYASNSTLPATHTIDQHPDEPLSGMFETEPNMYGSEHSIHSYVSEARWALEGTGPGGYVEVTFQDTHVQAAIAGKKVRLHLHPTDNLSFLRYAGCTTNILGGRFDGDDIDPINEALSPILPECMVDNF